MTPPTSAIAFTTKSKEHVLAEREARRRSKQAGKQKKSSNLMNIGTCTTKIDNIDDYQDSIKINADVNKIAIQHEQYVSEDNAEKIHPLICNDMTTTLVSNHLTELMIDSGTLINKKKLVLSKAERRAIQEAQRTSKTIALDKQKNNLECTNGISKYEKNISSVLKKIVSNDLSTSLHRVKLFSHLYCDSSPSAARHRAAINCNLHPAIVKLGTQYANRIIVGSNARCISFMNAMKIVICDYKTPPEKEFARSLESAIQQCIAFLYQCRPLSVSITNALKHIKWQISQFTSDQQETEQRLQLLDSINTYVRDQVDKAAQAISISVQEKISNGDVILTFGCSSLISHILDEAQKHKIDFRVVVVDARPDHEGQQMLQRLVGQGIRCTCVLINAVGFIMPVVTKVFLGVHALMANGYVMSRSGTAQVALVARAHNVPVLACCETHKFSERVQTDAFVYNEIGQPDDLVLSATNSNSKATALSIWGQIVHLTPLNLCYDITPPELVTAVVTELAILPCTSVPVILRIQPSSV